MKVRFVLVAILMALVLIGARSFGFESSEQDFKLTQADSTLSLDEISNWASIRPNTEIKIAMVTGASVIAQVIRVKRSSHGNIVLIGHTPTHGNLLLVVSQSGHVHGSLEDGATAFRLEQYGDRHLFTPVPYRVRLLPPDNGLGSLYLERFQTRSSGDEMHYREQSSPLSRGASELEAAFPAFEAEPRFIDLLVYYDDALPNPMSVIDGFLALSNEALHNSGLSFEFRITGTKGIAIPATMSNTELLSEMRDVQYGVGSTEIFSDLMTDRATFRADLVHLIRYKSGNFDGSCGVAFRAVKEFTSRRQMGLAVTEWRPDGPDYTCSMRTFGHELGHNLGAAHDRETVIGNAEALPSLPYAYGYSVDGIFKTIMDSSGSNAPQKYQFSDPDNVCSGEPCGIPRGRTDSADNTMALEQNYRFISAFDGDKYDAASTMFYPYVAPCANGEGEFRGVGVFNQWSKAIYLRGNVRLKSDGTIYDEVTWNPGRKVDPGRTTSETICESVDEHPVGTEVTEQYFFYEHPETGVLLEGPHIKFDGSEGEYAMVRAVATSGGSITHNPAIYAKKSEKVVINFQAKDGYKLENVDGTCPGSLFNNTYTVEPLYGSCWAVGRFVELNSAERAQARFQNLLDSLINHSRN